MSAISTGPRQTTAAGRSGPGRLLRGPAADPRWARPALLAVLALTALLYAAGLSRNGWANDFYSAAVQAGTTSWKAFFFGSFDASSFITVDKTPASLWVMELSARVFGLNYWSVLLPQAAEGVASVAVLYAAVRRWSGPVAGLIAANLVPEATKRVKIILSGKLSRAYVIKDKLVSATKGAKGAVEAAGGRFEV